MLWVDVSVLAALATQLSGPELADASALVDEDAEAWSRGKERPPRTWSQPTSPSAPGSPRSTISPALPPT
jgi:hypothetical protein